MGILYDYLKCVKKNKATFGSAITFIATAGLSVLSKMQENNLWEVTLPLCIVSSGVLLTTAFALGTYDAYLTMRFKINYDGFIPEKSKYAYSYAPYCTRAGMELAAEEAGLENKLKEPIPELSWNEISKIEQQLSDVKVEVVHT